MTCAPYFTLLQQQAGICLLCPRSSDSLSQAFRGACCEGAGSCSGSGCLGFPSLRLKTVFNLVDQGQLSDTFPWSLFTPLPNCQHASASQFPLRFSFPRSHKFSARFGSSTGLGWLVAMARRKILSHRHSLGVCLHGRSLECIENNGSVRVIQAHPSIRCWDMYQKWYGRCEEHGSNV